MERILVSLFVACVALTVSEATVCTKDDQCGANQCCYIKPEFMVVSKRQLLLPHQSTHSKTGVCENYRPPHEQCGPLETANGHCGCGTGMTCKWVPDVIASPVARRKLVSHNEPGAYRCA